VIEPSFNINSITTTLYSMVDSISITSMFSLEGQTAMVIGGIRGIGKSVTLALAEAGANIVLVQVIDLLVQ